MSANHTIDFWFTIGSTYTYLTVARLHKVEAASGVSFRWRPFNARAIMQEMDNIPFATKPIKLACMWRDIERRALKYGLPIKVPAPYPLKNFDLASRIAIVGEMEGWCPDYVRASYRRWFVEGKEVGTEPNLSESLAETLAVESEIARQWNCTTGMGRNHRGDLPVGEARDEGVCVVGLVADQRFGIDIIKQRRCADEIVGLSWYQHQVDRIAQRVDEKKDER